MLANQATELAPDSNRLSLHEAMYRQLLGAILNGIFKPGQMLRQEEIAARLGVSRGPLREALPRLEAEGMVVLYARRGYAVTSLDPDEIDELFELRMLLEVKLARRAASRRTAKDIARVQQINLELGHCVSSLGRPELRSRLRWFELNFEFHDALLRPAGLRQHFRMLQTLRSQIEPYIRMETCLTGGLDEAQNEHDALLAPFIRGDSERFAALIGEHVSHTQQRLMHGLRESGQLDRMAA